MRRLLLVVLLAAAAYPVAASAAPVACVRTINSKGVHFDVCVPAVVTANETCKQVLNSPDPSLPDVYACRGF